MQRMFPPIKNRSFDASAVSPDTLPHRDGNGARPILTVHPPPVKFAKVAIQYGISILPQRK